MKKFFSIIVCVCLLLGLIPVSSFALDDDGKIDLYEVFSNKADRMKTEVGSRVYKWSMHLPDDAIVYKSDRANYFNMSTTSYQSSIQLEVNKNTDELTLEEMLYKMQNNTRRDHYWRWGDKEFSVNIATDALGQRYIRIIKAESFYDYYMVDNAAEEFRDYIENRIYIQNNYIYNLTVRMAGEFYRQHEEMFDKLLSSFRLVFDENNPYIKELSDSVSTTREYKNTSYGWTIDMSPYWKLEDTPNARHQSFRPVYTDEELSGDSEINKKNEEEFKVPEGITVSLISSSQGSESASSWVEKELQMLQNNYNSDVYEILSNQSGSHGAMDARHLVIRYKTVTKKPYIVHNLYVLGSGYKYLVSATMDEVKYNDSTKRSSFEKMLNSFKLDSKNLSKYIGKIVAAESLIDLSVLKELKVKKYDFSTKISRSFDISGSNQGYSNMYYNEFYDKYSEKMYRENISNNQLVTAFEPSSSMFISMSAGLNTSEMDEIISKRMEKYLNDNEVRMKLANVRIRSSENNGSKLYYIEKEYDLNAIKTFVNNDSTKIYDLERLRNEYEYIVKIGQDVFTQSVYLPVANTTSSNKLKISELWKNTLINKVNYNTLSMSWTEHKLDEFDEGDKKPGAEEGSIRR